MNEVAEFVQGFLAGLFEDTTTGWNDGYKDSIKNSTVDNSPMIPYSVGSILLGIFALFMLFGVVALVVQFHYRVLYKPLFLRPGVGYSLLYLLWLFVFWRLLIFVTNGFKTLVTAQQITYATVITGICVAWAFVQNLRQNRQEQLVLAQQKIQAELDALKAQVNPHFLFNALNNLYGTAIVEDSPRTAESIQQLSGIVRYVMEESKLERTDVARELRFLDDYVELQRMRIPHQDNIDIRIKTHWDEQPAQIVPLLLNPLIENAFKYGISLQYPCRVHIDLRIENGVLRFQTENTLLPRTLLDKGTGMGVANVRKRLALAYPGRHTFETTEGDGVFLVNLTIILYR